MSAKRVSWVVCSLVVLSMLVNGGLCRFAPSRALSTGEVPVAFKGESPRLPGPLIWKGLAAATPGVRVAGAGDRGVPEHGFRRPSGVRTDEC